MTLFDTQPWIITAAPVPAVDHESRSSLSEEPVFREPPRDWPTGSPVAAVEAATSALSPLSRLAGTAPPPVAPTVYDLPQGPTDTTQVTDCDLVLIVDTSPSMSAWYPTVNAIAACLYDLPLFHSVRVIKMQNRRPTQYSDLFSTSDTETLKAPRLSEGRAKVTLIITDGVGAAWHRHLLHQELHQWATSHTVAILHALPHHHWALSGIRPQPIQLRAPHPWCTNQELETGERPPSTKTANGDSVLIPVLEIRKRWLEQWTRLLETGPLVHQQALNVSSSVTPSPIVPAPTPARDDAPRADQLITDFHASASEQAFNLAILLAAAPLNRHVMQLISAELAPAATARDLSAVLTSGLLVSLEPSIGVDNPYGKITFDFLPGVRQSLLALGESSQTQRATALLENRLSPYAPTLRGITRRLRSPTEDGLPALTEHSTPYLEIERCLLTALSGATTAHQSVANALRDRLNTGASRHPSGADT
ncbi:SAV_2336 N-terminal domain-related protein [Streptomyces sp. NPDC048171]|uniref:SAV_2336 N-terminal domain-related protein n=1 Tax=Streptomyces sp. NPDC048171 TaxID=3365504 RepID=UPI003715640E